MQKEMPLPPGGEAAVKHDLAVSRSGVAGDVAGGAGVVLGVAAAAAADGGRIQFATMIAAIGRRMRIGLHGCGIGVVFVLLLFPIVPLSPMPFGGVLQDGYLRP